MPLVKKRPPNAFALFMKAEFKSRQSNTRPTDYAKVVAKKWRELDASQKQIWVNMAAQVKSKFPKRPTTTGRPKKPRSAFIFFCSERREQVRRENPTKNMPVIAKILGKMWSRLSSEEKAKYMKMAESDKKRYYGTRTGNTTQVGQRTRAGGHRSRTRNQSAPQTHAQRAQMRNQKAKTSSRNSFFSSRFVSSSSESSNSDQG